MSEVKKLLKAAWREFWRQVRRSIQMFFLWVGFRIYPDNWDESLERVRREAIDGILNVADQAVTERLGDLDYMFGKLTAAARAPYGNWKGEDRLKNLLEEVNKYRTMQGKKETTLP